MARPRRSDTHRGVDKGRANLTHPKGGLWTCCLLRVGSSALRVTDYHAHAWGTQDDCGSGDDRRNSSSRRNSLYNSVGHESPTTSTLRLPSTIPPWRRRPRPREISVTGCATPPKQADERRRAGCRQRRKLPPSGLSHSADRTFTHSPQG